MVYTTSNEKEADNKLANFGDKQEDKTLIVVKSWNNNWKELKIFSKISSRYKKTGIYNKFNRKFKLLI